MLHQHGDSLSSELTPLCIEEIRMVHMVVLYISAIASLRFLVVKISIAKLLKIQVRLKNF